MCELGSGGGGVFDDNKAYQIKESINVGNEINPLNKKLSLPSILRCEAIAERVIAMQIFINVLIGAFL